MGWLLLDAFNALLCLIGLGDRAGEKAGPDQADAAMIVLGGAFCLAVVSLALWLTTR